MWEHLCECFARMTSPSVQELLRSLQTQNVCTNIQCFENNEAAFNLTPRPQVVDNSIVYVFLFSFIILWLHTMPTSLSFTKFRSIN